jgi:diguanylate cyclase
LLLLDVDHLKSINDMFGHVLGDAALRLVAEALRRTCRSRDLAARWGGDEFVVLVPGANAAQALVLAQRIRATLRQLAGNQHSPAPVSVSIGISDLSSTPSRRANDLFSAADRALYRAKTSGRDRVFTARRPWGEKDWSTDNGIKEQANV